MSYTLPSVKAKPTVPLNYGFDEGPFGIPDVMTSGLTSARNTLEAAHPLERSEKNHFQFKHDLNMSVLRTKQGLHAPLRIAMELKSVKQIGHLPFLQSHNALYESLTGRDLEVGPEDLFNTGEFVEVVGQPHAVVEKSLGIL